MTPIIAAVSMSLHNVLAVAGAAQEHASVPVFWLLPSVALMGVASAYIARLLNRFQWITWVGLLVTLNIAPKDVLWWLP